MEKQMSFPCIQICILFLMAHAPCSTWCPPVLEPHGELFVSILLQLPQKGKGDILGVTDFDKHSPQRDALSWSSFIHLFLFPFLSGERQL